MITLSVRNRLPQATFSSNMGPCEPTTFDVVGCTSSLLAGFMSVLKLFMSTTAINGFLNRGLMYIMSTAQFRAHLYAG
jgi:hypothetical protein